MTSTQSLSSMQCLHFTGRQNELTQLASSLQTSDQNHVAVAVIQGSLGSGKTQLAIKYALQKSKRPGGAEAMCFDASSPVSLKTYLQRQFRHLRRGLQATSTRALLWESEDEDLLRTFKQKLENSLCDWILLIDNVTAETWGLVQSMMPQECRRRGEIILTTRVSYLHRSLIKLRREPGSAILLRGLTPSDASNLLSTLCKKVHNFPINKSMMGKADPVMQKLGYIPILVCQFAAWLKAERWEPNVSKIEPDFEQICLRNCNTTPGTSSSFSQLWKAQLTQLEGTRSVAADLLCIFSLLSPANINISSVRRGLVSNEVMSFWHNAGESHFLKEGCRLQRLQSLLSMDEELTDVLNTLTSLAVLEEPSPFGRVSFVHPMIQVATRVALMPSEDDRRGWLAFTSHVFGAGLITMPAPKTVDDQHEYLKDYAPHAEALWGHCQKTSYCMSFLCAFSSAWADSLEAKHRYALALRWKGRAVQGYNSGSFQVDPTIKQSAAQELSTLRHKLQSSKKIPKPTQSTISQDVLHLAPCGESKEDWLFCVRTWIAENDVTHLRGALPDLRKQYYHSKSQSGPESLATLRLQDMLVRTLSRIGRSEKNLSVCKQARRLGYSALVAKLKTLPEHDGEVLATLDGLVGAMWARFAVFRGKFRQKLKAHREEGQSKAKQMHQTLLKQLGAEHPKTVKALANTKIWENKLRGQHTWQYVLT